MYSTICYNLWVRVQVVESMVVISCKDLASRPGRMIGRRFSTLRPGLEAGKDHEYS